MKSIVRADRIPHAVRLALDLGAGVLLVGMAAIAIGDFARKIHHYFPGPHVYLAYGAAAWVGLRV